MRPQDVQTLTAPATGPNKNIYICNNHCTERSDTDASWPLIKIVGNTTLSGASLSEGWKNIFISGNYLGPLDTGSAGTYLDIDPSTTGMQNLVIRDNWFNNTGVNNVGSYPYAARNFGTATTTRYSNSGTSSITGTSASVTVTHGVEYTPAAQHIYVTPTTSWGSATKFWVSNITSTTFQINRSPAPGASETMTFAWQVSRRL
jgi:hypothetical protein